MYCRARSSSIGCSVSRFWPLIGTLTEHHSSDHQFFSSGCNRTKSLASAMLWIFSSVGNVSILFGAAAFLFLNLSSRDFSAGLAIENTLSVGLVMNSPFSGVVTGVDDGRPAVAASEVEEEVFWGSAINSGPIRRPRRWGHSRATACWRRALDSAPSPSQIGWGARALMAIMCFSNGGGR